MQCLNSRKKQLIFWLLVLLLFALLGRWINAEADYLVQPPKAPEIAKKPPIPPILERIAACESGNRQFDEKGIILGKVNRYDRGRFQINEKYHGEKATELGYDLNTLEGNTNFALWLFEREGAKPWNASRKCWDTASL